MGEVIQSVVTQAGGGAEFVNFVIMMAAMFGILYFMLIRPQRKQQNEHRNLLSSLKKGDEVVLSSGIFGRIWAVEDQTLSVEIADKTRVKVLKSSVHSLAKNLQTSQAKSSSTEGSPTAVPAADDKPKTKNKK
jgi:preprotein translocase subunit YajC